MFTLITGILDKKSIQVVDLMNFVLVIPFKLDYQLNIGSNHIS